MKFCPGSMRRRGWRARVEVRISAPVNPIELISRSGRAMGGRCYHARAARPSDVTDEIPVFKPLLEREEFAACEEALRVGWLGPGAYVGRFEQALAKLLGAGDRQVV